MTSFSARKLWVQALLVLLLIASMVFLPLTVEADHSKISTSIFDRIENISIDSAGNLVSLTANDKNPAGIPAEPSIMGVFSGVAADNKYAYLVNHVFYEGSPDVGLWIVDFLSPGGPYLKGFVNIDSPNDVFVQSNYAYVVSGYADYSFLFNIVDVSDPSSPKVIGTAPLSSIGKDVFVEGSYAYVAIGGMGMGVLQVINIANPSLPQPVGIFYPGWGALGLFEHEKIVYLGDDYGLYALDVNHPESPEQISVLDAVHGITSVRMLANLIDFTSTDIYGKGALTIVDMKNPAMPQLIGSYDLGEESANDLLLLGNYAFVANGEAGLRFMDLSDIYNPITLDLYNTSNSALDLALNDNNLYLADYDSVYYFSLNLYSINGKVVDPSGDPLNNFPVQVGSDSHNLTDADGSYSLGGLFEGDYLPEAIKSGYHTVLPADPVHVPPAVTIPDIVVAPNSISGQILAANHKPIAGIKVKSSDGEEVLSDSTGDYFLGELLEQAYTIVPTDTAWVFQPTQFSFTVPPYTHRRNFWILPPPITIQLTPGIQNEINYQEVQGTTTTISFPQDVVSTTTTISLNPMVMNGDWKYKFTGHAFDLAASWPGLVTAGFSFNSPITVTIEYSDYDLRAITDEASLVLLVNSGGGWEDAALTCDPPSLYSRDLVNGMISIAICDAGEFGLFGPTHEVILPILIKASLIH